MTTEITDDQSKGQQVKSDVDLVLNDVAGKVWASPNTALGLLYGGSGYLYGIATGQDVKVSIGNNAIQFEGNPVNLFGVNGAITLGNVINYVGNATQNDITSSYYENNRLMEIYNGYQNKSDFYQWYYSSYKVPTDQKIILGKHEQEHTYQSERFGPLFLPVYILSGGVSHNNWLEKNADKSGNYYYLNLSKP